MNYPQNVFVMCKPLPFIICVIDFNPPTNALEHRYFDCFVYNKLQHK